MNCPNGCATPLSMTDRQGVEIDYCPTCRGVWLDRGELDKIIDRVAATPVAAAASPPPPSAAAYDRDRSDRDRQDWRDRPDWDDGRGKRKKKRGSFLEDMFDFG